MILEAAVKLGAKDSKNGDNSIDGITLKEYTMGKNTSLVLLFKPKGTPIKSAINIPATTEGKSSLNDANMFLNIPRPFSLKELMID